MRAPTRMLTPQTPRRRRSQEGVGPAGLLDFRVPFRMRRGAQRPADQGSRLSERRRREFERDPAITEVLCFSSSGFWHQPCRIKDLAPLPDSRVAFSLVTFSWRSKRKLLRRRAHTPASARCKGMPITIKTIAANAYPISARSQKYSIPPRLIPLPQHPLQRLHYREGFLEVAALEVGQLLQRQKIVGLLPLGDLPCLVVDAQLG